MSSSILSGIRVLDIGTMLGGPVAATLLADFGAEVIKLERPDGGDTLRYIGPFIEGESLYWANDGRNKKSATINFREEQGVKLFYELVKVSDVVVENFRPGTLKKWGIAYDDLKKVKPDIVMCSVSGFGQTGPYAQRAAYDRIALAFSGYLFITGFSDRPPVRPGIAIGDYMGALYAAFSIMLALYHRDKTGNGQHIDLALYESLFRFTEVLTSSYDKLGIVRPRRGNRHFAAAPGGHFLTKDGLYVVITISSDALFLRFAEGMGKPELALDTRFKTHDLRWENIDEINIIVQEWVLLHDAETVIKSLDKVGIPCAKVYSIEDIVNDPHYQERNSFVEVEHPRLGTMKVQGVFPKMSETPGKISSLGPLLGEHNDEVYQGLLGLTENEIKKLKEGGII